MQRDTHTSDIKEHVQEELQESTVDATVDKTVISSQGSDEAPLPPGCFEFAKKCGVRIPQGATGSFLESWQSVGLAFEFCCIGGGHHKSTCKSIAEELVEQHQDTKLTASPAFCEALMDLHKTHIDVSTDKAELMPSFQQRAERMYHRMQEVKETAPAFAASLLAMALVRAGVPATAETSLVDVGKMSAGMVVSYLATTLKGCLKDPTDCDQIEQTYEASQNGLDEARGDRDAQKGAAAAAGITGIMAIAEDCDLSEDGDDDKKKKGNRRRKR